MPNKKIAKKTSKKLAQIVITALEDLKATNVIVIPVQKLTAITDFMIIASGTSNRHLNALAADVVEAAKAANYPVLSTEGEKTGEWVLVDLDDVIVHIMLPPVRTFYNLEALWQVEE